MAAIGRSEGDLVRGVPILGLPADFVADRHNSGAFRLPRPVSTGRTVHDCRVIHIHDVAADPDYPQVTITVGRQRTSLGVPLLREGKVVGVILLARQHVEPFSVRPETLRVI